MNGGHFWRPQGLRFMDQTIGKKNRQIMHVYDLKKAHRTTKPVYAGQLTIYKRPDKEQSRRTSYHGTHANRRFKRNTRDCSGRQ